MPILCVCPGCGKSLGVPDHAQGKPVGCAACQLFVISTPPLFAVRGREYTYAVKVRSKRGGLKYRIDAGPDGMKVAADGTVTWQVPAGLPEVPIDVIMTIGDGAGHEIFHTFRVLASDTPDGARDEGNK